MKKSKRINLIILIILLFISFILLFCDLFFRDRNKTYQISVIVSGKSDESFMILKEGAEQAAAEMNANIRFIFLSKDNDEKEQIELIKRESKNEVDALLVCPIESEGVINVIEEVKSKVPVVLMQSLMKTKSTINKVICNEYQLGNSLMEEALKNINKNDNIMIIDSNCNSTLKDERYKGILNILGNNKNHYLVSSIENFKDYKEFYNFINSNDIKIILCLDRNITEKVADFKKEIISKNKIDNILLFGVGNTNKIISLLEEEIINATAVQNEFNIGYISVKNSIAINNREKVKEIQKIKSTVISSKEMYLPKNERILFQFIR